MSAPLRIEPDYIGWAAYYDPEGPVGRGKSKEAALGDLIDLCDDDHRGPLLLGAIVALTNPDPAGTRPDREPSAPDAGGAAGGAGIPSGMRIHLSRTAQGDIVLGFDDGGTAVFRASCDIAGELARRLGLAAYYVPEDAKQESSDRGSVSAKPWCEQSYYERALGLLRSARSEITPIRGETARLCEQIDGLLADIEHYDAIAPDVPTNCGSDTALLDWLESCWPVTNIDVFGEADAELGMTFDDGRREGNLRADNLRDLLFALRARLQASQAPARGGENG